jgi:hypothetical protein
MSRRLRPVLPLASLVAAFLVVGCDRSPPAGAQPAPQGLPPLDPKEAASASPGPGPGPAPAPAAGPGAGVPSAPGAGVPSGPMPQDAVHRGLSPHGAGGPAAPAAPEDPNAVLEGTIDVSPALRAEVKPGDIIFLSAKPAEGAGNAHPVAVDRIDVSGFPLRFRLTSANALMGGELKGAMVLVARVDRDGEAMTRQPGDIEGTAQATVPAQGIKIVLDTRVAK